MDNENRNGISKFTIRVYAVITDENNRILLSDELHKGVKMTKFPGGGLEFGESTFECIKRESLEEFKQELIPGRHIYTTDFFQRAMFFDNTQVMSIYYEANFKDEIKFRTSSKPFDFPGEFDDNQSFRWKKISELTTDDVTFPIDKKVVKLIIEHKNDIL